MKNYIYIFLVLALFAGCKTQKAGTKSTAPNSALTEKTARPQKEQMKIDALFLDAIEQTSLENYSEALKLYMQVLRVDPEHAPALYEIAKIRYAQTRLSDAINFAEKAVRLDPDNEWYASFLADLYRTGEYYSKSTKIYENLAKSHPENIDYYFSWANAYLYEGKAQQAIDVYNQIEKREGISEQISLQKSKIYQIIGDKEKANAEIEKLSEAFPQEAKYMRMLAETAIQKKNYPAALKYYNRILQTNPEDPFVHISLAEYYHTIGDSAKAFNELKLGFANKNLEADTKSKIMFLYYSNKSAFFQHKEQVTELLNILSQTHPQDIKIAALYANYLTLEENYAGAQKQYYEVLKIDSSQYEIWEALLYANLSIPDTQALINDALRAKELFPEQTTVYYFLSLGYFEINNIKEAIATAKKGLKNLADINSVMYVQFNILLGDLYYKEKMYAECDAAYKEVLKVDPNSLYALNNYAYYLAERNERLDEAERMSRRTLLEKPNDPTYLDTYGWVLYKKGKYQDAYDALRTAADKTEEKDGTLLEHLGDVLWKLKKHDEAVLYWEKALEAGGSDKKDVLERKVKEKKLFE